MFVKIERNTYSCHLSLSSNKAGDKELRKVVCGRYFLWPRPLVPEASSHPLRINRENAFRIRGLNWLQVTFQKAPYNVDQRKPGDKSPHTYYTNRIIQRIFAVKRLCHMRSSDTDRGHSIAYTRSIVLFMTWTPTSKRPLNSRT